MNNAKVENALGAYVVVRGSNCFYCLEERFTFDFKCLTLTFLDKRDFYPFG